MKKTFAVLAGLGLAGAVIYRYRRSLIARLFGLSPPRHDVSVARDIAVAMPDGVQLLADRYSPKAKGHFPTVLIRTPYGRGGMSVVGQGFAERGYHVFVQDVRGCFGSEGEFSPHVNEAGDGRATLDWIARQPWFNGELGTFGPSYLGYVQWAVAADAPPFLKALVPSITSPENFSVTHPDGAFGLDTRFRWIYMLHTQERPPVKRLLSMLSGQEARNLEAGFMHLPLLEADVAATGEIIPFYREMLTLTQPDQPYWTARDHSPSVPQLSAPVHLVGGWYDYYLRGVLATYAALKAARRNPYLTIGPWYHSHLGAMLAGIREGLAWFEAQLKGDRSRLRAKPVRVYVMGAGRRLWREMDEWPPPARETRYYLHPEARLLPEAPTSTSPPDRYRYDPADPTPAVGGASLSLREAGPKDNRSLEARPDVLCYTTPPFENDIEVIGPVRLELFVRSSLAYTDFFGRLCDVYPDGRSINVCDGLFRVEPGKGEPHSDGGVRIEVDMRATAYRFRRGHRLRLQVSSGAHPLWSRNLGTGEPLATGTGMAAAEQTIYRDNARPSAVVLPIIKAD